jgi:hypothetical protein
MKHRSAESRFRSPIVLLLVTVVALAPLSQATGNISKGDLQGPWSLAIVGSGGCGMESYNVTFTLNATGVATNATLKGHSQLCGDSTVTSQSFTVTSLTTNGSGFATLTCGSGCTFYYTIQVSPDRSTFSIVEFTSLGNFWQGVAIHQ